MKKGLKITLIVLGVLAGIALIVGIYFIFKDNNIKSETTKLLKNASMIIKEGTLTNTGCTVIITDTEKEEIHTYGDSFSLEIKKDNKWQNLKPIIKDYVFNLIGYYVNENNELEQDIKWEWLYGKLEPGEYRLVKDAAINYKDSYLGNGVVYAEFTIEEPDDLSLEEKLYKKVNPSEDYALLKYLYTNNNSFDNNYIIAVGISNYIDENSNVEDIKEEDVDTNIKEIFGNDIKYNHQKTYIYKKNYCGFEFNETKKEYTALHGCDGDMFHKLYRKVVDTKKFDKTIEIYEKLIFAEWSSDFKDLTIFNNNIDKKVIKKLDSNSSINIDDYLNDATTYKYTFEKVNDNYIFKSLTK